MRRDIKIIWLPDVINKITLFMFLMSLLVFLTFMAGNVQGFIDSTQILLLKLFRVTALIFIVTGVYNLLIDIVVIMRNRRVYSLRVVFTVIGEVLIIVFFIGTTGILAIING